MYLEFDDGYATTLHIPFDVIPIDQVLDVRFLTARGNKVVGFAVHVFGGWLHTYDLDWGIEMFDRIMEHYDI